MRNTNKSPLHPSALRLRDLHIGMRVITFNVAFGNMGEYEVLSEPFVGYLCTKDGKHPSYSTQTMSLVVTLRRVSTGSQSTHSLQDMGLHPYKYSDWRWNDCNFTIEAKKKNLLPEPDKALAAEDKIRHSRFFNSIDRPSYKSREPQHRSYHAGRGPIIPF